MSGKVVIIGSGSWGLALANLLASGPLPVSLWPPRQEEYDFLSRTRANPALLPGITLDARVSVVPEPDIEGEGVHVLVVVPSHAVRSVVSRVEFRCLPGPDSTLISATKGLEEDTLLRMSEVLRQVVPAPWRERIVALSGPSHAEEVARNIPTAVVVASPHEEVAVRARALLARDRFRVYVSDDLIGVEIGGALKNVIALAAGISDGLGFGDNSKGALLTRGMVEIARLGVAMGAKEKTFSGLTGIGDLITTCMSRHSRNRYVGEQIGRGRRLDEILAGMSMVAEGVRTTKAAYALAKRHDVVMPITTQVYRILFEGLSPEQAMRELMVRDPKTEDGRVLAPLNENKAPALDRSQGANDGRP